MLAPLTCWQTVPPIAIKPGLAVAAIAGGVVSAEGVLGALSVVVFTGLLVGSIMREDWKVKQKCIKRTDSSVFAVARFVMDTASVP